MEKTFKHITQDFDFEADGTILRNNRRAEFKEPKWITDCQSNVILGIGLSKRYYSEVRVLYDQVHRDMVKLKREGQLNYASMDALFEKYTSDKISAERRRHVVRSIGYTFQHLTNQ